MARTLKIVNGPDRMHLAFSLLVGGCIMQSSVCFRVEENDGSNKWPEHVKLDSVAREDGGGENFNITGYNVANNAKVKIFYSMRHRMGLMTFC